MILSIPSVLEKISVEITDEYIDGFIQAENTFLYQLVFDTRKRMLIPLNPYPEDLGPKDLPFAGSYEHQHVLNETLYFFRYMLLFYVRQMILIIKYLLPKLS